MPSGGVDLFQQSLEHIGAFRPNFLERCHIKTANRAGKDLHDSRLLGLGRPERL
jgi:hypothetical protein